MIQQTSLSPKSKLAGVAFDYCDCYECALPDSPSRLSMPTIGEAFFRSSPAWSKGLFQLRNRLVARLGLKVSDAEQDWEWQLQNFSFDPGQALGLFNVYARDEREVILGEDDRHLSFRVSLLQYPETNRTPRRLAVATVVKFNHWTGNLYFWLIKPFHKAIVKNMLRSTVKNLAQ